MFLFFKTGATEMGLGKPDGWIYIFCMLMLLIYTRFLFSGMIKDVYCLKFIVFLLKYVGVGVIFSIFFGFTLLKLPKSGVHQNAQTMFYRMETTTLMIKNIFGSKNAK